MEINILTVIISICLLETGGLVLPEKGGEFRSSASMWQGYSKFRFNYIQIYIQAIILEYPRSTNEDVSFSKYETFDYIPPRLPFVEAGR